MTRTAIGSVLTIAAVTAAGIFAPAARADIIYRSIGSGGEVSYASRPAPGARESTAIDIPSLSPEQRRASQLLRRQDKALSDEVNARLRSLESEWRRVDLEITSAQRTSRARRTP